MPFSCCFAWNVHGFCLLSIVARINSLLWWFKVYTWGKGYCGALGHGDEVDKTTPELLNGLKDNLAVQVCSSIYFHHLC